MMPAVDSQIHIPVRQEHRLPQSQDIIDVDAFEADDIVYVGSARPSQRRRVAEDGRAVSVYREVIHVTDNQDDNEIQFIGHNPARSRPPLGRIHLSSVAPRLTRAKVRRERLFSPPPPPQADSIPPVPRIPQRFLASRPHPSSSSPGPIIPNEDPFPFEAGLQPPVEQPALAAAPSHHVPNMGFGGAFIAGVRHIIRPRNTSHRPHRIERRNSWGVSGSFVFRWDSMGIEGEEEEEEILDGLGDMGFWGDDDNPFGARRVRTQLERAFKQRDRGNQAEPDYRPEYTHPDRPQPGSTYDFSSSSSPSVADEDVSSPSRRASSSGSRLCEVTLVCASCRDPLILGASDVGEDRAKRKLWGLRCGHLLDGKCIEKLMDPAPPTLDAAGSSSMKTDTASVSHLSFPGHDSSDSSMRTRLRPRHGMSGSSTSSSHPVPATPSSGRRTTRARGQATHRGNRKGKGKMKAPVVEDEHEWMCPVSGCGHVHLSLLTDGRWTMDEKRGAIAVFV